MQALICRSNLLAAWRKERAEVAQIQFLEVLRLEVSVKRKAKNKQKYPRIKKYNPKRFLW